MPSIIHGTVPHQPLPASLATPFSFFSLGGPVRSFSARSMPIWASSSSWVVVGLSSVVCVSCISFESSFDGDLQGSAVQVCACGSVAASQGWCFRQPSGKSSSQRLKKVQRLCTTGSGKRCGGVAATGSWDGCEQEVLWVLPPPLSNLVAQWRTRTQKRTAGKR